LARRLLFDSTQLHGLATGFDAIDRPVLGDW
jgi:hypothetical protein